MAVLNSGTIIAVAEETVLGGGKVAAWVDADVISCQDDSGLTPAIESLEREQTLMGALLNVQQLQGKKVQVVQLIWN